MKSISPSPYSPAEFAKLEPGGKSHPLTVGQLSELICFLQDNPPEEEELLIALWYFLFRMDLHIIERYAGVSNAYGYVERLRFRCRKHLELPFAISDADMGRALDVLLREYEIVLLGSRQGICWTGSPGLRYDETLRQIGEAKQRRVIAELEYQAVNGAGWIAVPDETIGQHIRQLMDIPLDWDRLLHLRYVEGYSYRKLARENIVRHPKGTVEYLRRRFAEQMQLPGLPDEDSMARIVSW